VAQGVSLRFFRAIGYFWMTKWLPMFKVQVDAIREIIGFSGNLLGFRMINYWARNVDNLLIGRTLGSVQLGFYNQAYTLMMYPIRMLSSVINPSLQPVFATAQDEPEKIAPTYLLLLEMIALITFPLGIFLFLFAGPVIRVLWGNQWDASVPVFEVLAFLTMIQPLMATSGSVFIARNKAQLLFRLGSVTSVIIIAGIAAGSVFGIVGVAAGYAITYWGLATPLTLYYLSKTLEIKHKQMLKLFVKPVIITLILVPALWFFRSLNFPWPNVGIVAGAGTLALVIWAGAGFALYRKQFQTILQVLRLRYHAKV
jgi:PST family polysaccharide transporter